MPSRRTRWGLAAALAAVALAACAPASAGTESRTVAIRIHYSAFDASEIRVEPGSTVTFVVENADPIDHEFILGDQGVQLAHENGTEAYHPPRPGEMTVPAGETVSTTYTFGEAGQLLFGCHLPGHYAYGMSGLVTIG